MAHTPIHQALLVRNRCHKLLGSAPPPQNASTSAVGSQHSCKLNQRTPCGSTQLSISKSTVEHRPFVPSIKNHPQPRSIYLRVYSTSMCCGTYRCAQRGLRSWLRVGTPCTCLSICNQLAATRGGRGVCTPAMMRPSVRGTTASSCSRVEMTKSGLLPRAARIPARSGFPILFPPVVT